MKIGTNDISKIMLGGVEVSNIYLGTSQVYDGGDTPTPPEPSYDTQYLTIESTSDNNTIYWKKRASNKQGKTISASTDNGSTWIEYTSTSGNGITIATLNSGDKVLVKGENATYYESWNPQGIFASTSSFITYGNIMSLVHGDNFSGQTTLTSGNTFNGLFSVCTGLTSAENLVLPATTLADGCYSSLFGGCTSLTSAPELPATTLAENCYQGMFAGCMSLIYAPALPAATLTDSCYNNMFGGCSSLDAITCLATDISATDCTTDWTYEVASGGGYLYVPSGNPASWKCGVDGVPSDWTIEDTNGDTYECTGGGDGPSTDVPLANTFAVKYDGQWYESHDSVSEIGDIERYLGSLGGDWGPSKYDVEELAIGNETRNINLDGDGWDSCTGLTLAQNVTETTDIHNFPAMQWVNVMARELNYYEGRSSLFSYMNCCPIYVPEDYLSDYQLNWGGESTDDCDGSVADRLVAWTPYIDPNNWDDQE